jgi:uncharacterized protein Veg
MAKAHQTVGSDYLLKFEYGDPQDATYREALKRGYPSSFFMRNKSNKNITPHIHFAYKRPTQKTK